MGGTTVQLTAEWALWGEQDSRYQVLDCSDGTLGRDNFRTLLNRYSPGAIGNVPQVTVSWLEAEPGQYYVGVAIHDRADTAVPEADSRDMVQTKYFSVAFKSLATDAVSYTAMYQRFSRVRLPVADGHPVKVSISADRPAQVPSPVGSAPAGSAPADQGNWLAMRAAALLLTGKPVCVLRGQNVSLADRLLFIDEVAALLPYGMRSQLSASTWASSTYREHKLRLFFTSAARANDHVLTWGSDPDQTRIDDPRADSYLAWLRDDPPQRAARLARDVKATGFGPADVSRLVQRLDLRPVQPPAALRLPRKSRPQAAADRAKAGAAGPFGGRSSASTEQLLLSCASQLSGKQAGDAAREITELRRRLNDEPTEKERARYREVIAEHGLLAEHKISEAQQADLYEVLLRLAFDAPLSYASYRAVETACLSYSGGIRPLHQGLAQVIADRITVDSLPLLLLVLNGIGQHELREALRQVPPDALIKMTAAMTGKSQLRDGHAFVICTTVIRYLVQYPPSSEADTEKVRAALKENGFLAQVMERIVPDHHQFKLEMMTELLHLAYARKLQSKDMHDIFLSGESVPTPALLAAVLQSIDAKQVRRAVWLYSAGTVRHAGFTSSATNSLIEILNASNDLGTSSRPAATHRT